MLMADLRLNVSEFWKKRWAEVPLLDGAGLRRFGFITAGIIACLFGLVFPWLFGKPFPWWPWILSGTLALWAWLSPASLKPVYVVWMTIAVLLGWINSRVLMALVFFLVVLPMGVLMRLVTRDPLALKFDTTCSSYRVKRRRNEVANMEKPF
jgi:hypothetical protein